MRGHGYITSERGYAVNPAGLRQAAQQTRTAAAQDAAAARTFAGAVVDPSAFGRSGPAAEVARKWNDAVTARQTEATQLAERTNDMADQLDATADEYEGRERGNEQRLSRVAA
ncbi:type VII secretion target [Actinophytocola sp.]|uniref:type VII secretion target n=1 Tax=Actinophytocola sp. TaxID=1872138 RepID=UPI003D6BD2A3